MKVLTFGEIMLRLRAPGHERFFQSNMMEATFGGGEANVAVSLANYGMDATPSKHSSWTVPETQIVPAKFFFVCAAKRPAAMTIAQSLPFMSEAPRP